MAQNHLEIDIILTVALLVPIPSRFGIFTIFTYIWLICMVNVGKYTVHGCHGSNHIQANEPMKVISRSPWMQLWHGGLLLSCFTNQYACLASQTTSPRDTVSLGPAVFLRAPPLKKVTFDKPSGHQIVHLNKFECI